jgi:hypothetical protein|tara:strand:+ start:3938 stop:5422 length:1485 start_codon:yes stop_codon:yes gene_type:complete
MSNKKIYGLDLRSLGVFRIILGITLIYDLIFNKIIHYNNLYDYTNGIQGKSYLNSEIYRESFFSFFNSDYEMPFVFVIALIVYTLFISGYLYKIFSFLTLLFFAYISHKYFLTMIGADQIITALLVFSVFLPLDKAFTVKYLKPSLNKNVEIRGIAVWGILIQISLIYFFNAINKTGIYWLEGNAVKIALADTITSNMSYSKSAFYFSNLFSSITTYMTYAYELFFPLVLFFPYKNEKLRCFISFFIILFHSSIQIFMDVGYFHIVYICIAFLVLPSLFWNKLLSNKLSKKIINTQYNTIKRVIIISLIFLVIQRNFFNFCSRLTFSDTAIYQVVYYPFKYLNDLPLSTPFISQYWAFYSPDPPLELGVLTIEGESLDGEKVNLSEINPFDSKNNYKTEKSDYLRLLTLRMRHFFNLAKNDSKYRDNEKIIELRKIWSNYQLSRITKQHNLKDYSKIDCILYSCTSLYLIEKDTLSFKKINLFNIYVESKNIKQ